MCVVLPVLNWFNPMISGFPSILGYLVRVAYRVSRVESVFQNGAGMIRDNLLRW